MQFTKIKHKINVSYDRHITNFCSPERIFSLTNEEFIVITCGKVFKINRNTSKEEFIFDSVRANNSYFFHNNKLFTNPDIFLLDNYNYNNIVAPQIYDFNLDKEFLFFNNPIEDIKNSARYRKNYIVLPDFDDEFDFKIILKEGNGTPLLMKVNYSDIRKWYFDKIYVGETMRIRNSHIWIDNINKKIYCLENTNSKEYIVRDMSDANRFYPKIPWRYLINPFSIFKDKLIVAHQSLVERVTSEIISDIVLHNVSVNDFKISPCNNFLVFSSENKLFFLNEKLEQHKILTLPEDIIDFDFSPDGLTINLLTKECVITMDCD